MLVDNAIVVLENIDRHRRQFGKSPARAAYDGAREVWGAVLASTLTTVAVFLPVVFTQEEAGQLFKDIAIAVTCSVTLSLFVSVSVIPMLAAKLFGFAQARRERRAAAAGDSEVSGFELRALRPLKAVGRSIAGVIMALVEACLRSWATRLAVIVLLTGFAVGATLLFMPKMEYLPQGNRNFILSVLIPPPGQSVQERERAGELVFRGAAPFLGREAGPGGLPGIRDLFYVGARVSTSSAWCPPRSSAPRNCSAGHGHFQFHPRGLRLRLPGGHFSGPAWAATGPSTWTLRGRTWKPWPERPRRCSWPFPGHPGLAGAARAVLRDDLPRGAPDPAARPAARRRADRRRPGRVGRRAHGRAQDRRLQGRGRAVHRPGAQGREERVDSPEALYATLLSTPDGRLLPVSSLAELTRTTGINEIRHLERRRTFTLQVTPPETVPLEQAMETIQGGLIPQLRDRGALPGVDVRLSGAADKLQETRQTLQWNFILAVVIIYLLMSALFGNFIYPLVILFTVPLAGAGGFIGLRVQNLFVLRPLDVLTMLGFVILIGIVVNNAILIVHQSLNNIREGGMGHKEAVLDSVRTRLRPIYMSALTSIFGMLPLAVMPGPGSELYSGLGAVILSGLAFSTVFTVFVTPSLLMFFIGMEKAGDPAGARDADAGA
jgi:HAE1 family hydrophobic/amphiphilic exporter-1